MANAQGIEEKPTKVLLYAKDEDLRPMALVIRQERGNISLMLRAGEAFQSGERVDLVLIAPDCPNRDAIEKLYAAHGIPCEITGAAPSAIPAPPKPSTTEAALLGSDLQPVSWVLNGSIVTLGDVVRAAVERCGLPVAAWNSLDAKVREQIIAQEVEFMGLPALPRPAAKGKASGRKAGR